MSAQTRPHIALSLILPSWLIERNVDTLYRQIRRFIAAPVVSVQMAVRNKRHATSRNPRGRIAAMVLLSREWL